MQHHSNCFRDPKTVSGFDINENVDVIVISNTVIDDSNKEIRNMLDSIRGVSESIPIIFYGSDFNPHIYKFTYSYDINVVTESVTDEKEEFDALHNAIATTTAISAVELQDTTFSVAQSLMGAADDELELKIQWALESLGSSIGAVQCLIYNVSSDTENIGKSYSWEVTSEYQTELNTDCEHVSVIGDETIPKEEFPGFTDVLSGFSPVCYNEHCDRITEEFTRKKGTLLAIPVVINWELDSIFVVRTAVPQYWTKEVRIQLESIAELVVHTNRRREQRSELQRQNEQLEQFNSVISHDLQNPLSVAKGYVQLVKDTGDLSELDTAADAIIRMEEMINELLSLARQGEEIGETEPHPLHSVVSDAKSHVTVPDGDIDISQIPTDKSIVCAESRVRELFENLFRNAVDHCGESVTVVVRMNDDNEIVVGDNGPGIDPEKREKIFEHGYTGGNGTGFGLAIVQRIVDAHGWEIRIDESDAGGAAFIINPLNSLSNETD